MLKLERFTAPEEFQKRAADFLLGREVENNAMLSVADDLANSPEMGGYENPYLAVVEEGDAVVAASMMTPPRNLMVSFGAAREATSLFARDLHESGREPPGVTAAAGVSRDFAEAWRDLTGQTPRRGMKQRMHRLEAVRPVPEAPGRIRRATDEDRALLVDWFVVFEREVFGEGRDPEAARTTIGRVLDRDGSGLFIWEDDGPVAMAGYRGGAPNVARIAAVYTPPRFRNRGYATACVAALSRLLLEGGFESLCLYTDLANPTSNSVYRRIGYEPVCDMDEYRFG